ncbi:MAG: NHL repeat-containing protein [Thermomicrobiales bacterium]
MPDPREPTAEQLAAYWDEVVQDTLRKRTTVDRETEQLIARMHALYHPSVPDSPFRERLRKDLFMTATALPRAASPNGSSPFILPRSPMETAAGPPRGMWHGLTRGRVATLAAMVVLVLVLSAASLPFLVSRLGQPAENLPMLSALIHPNQVTPAVEVITGGDDPLAVPSGVAVAADGTLYVIDVPHDHIRVFNPDGSPKATWGTSGDGPGEFGFSFDFPWGDLAIAPDGNVYVLDPNLARIQVFTPDGTYLFGFGERGSEDGQILYPMGIGVGPNGNVYVADWQNHRVQVFDGQGTFLAAWDGTQDGGQPLAGPQDVAVDSDGTAWVTDEILQRVIGFAPDGSIVGSFGKSGNKPGEVWGLRGIAIDAADIIYVAEFENDRVQAFTRDGEVVGILGTRGEEPGQLTEPGYLAIGPDGTIYVTEERPKRLQAFAPNALIPVDLLPTATPGS